MFSFFNFPSFNLWFVVQNGQIGQRFIVCACGVQSRLMRREKIVICFGECSLGRRYILDTRHYLLPSLRRMWIHVLYVLHQRSLQLDTRLNVFPSIHDMSDVWTDSQSRDSVRSDQLSSICKTLLAVTITVHGWHL